MLGTQTRAPRGGAFPGWACGNDQCIAVGGGLALEETWIFSESAGAWSKLNCRRGPCPSSRWGTTVAYDPILDQFVLFGGEAWVTCCYDSEGLDDTHVFALGSWSAPDPFQRPSPRTDAASAFVPAPVNKVVLFGGWDVEQQSPLCDLWAWSGSDWESISASNSASAIPCLYMHSMAWETEAGQSPRLIVTGGYSVAQANTDTWAFTFTSATSGTWSQAPLTCENDATPRPGSRMALDIPSQKKVFFGGIEKDPNGDGDLVYDDTVICE